MTRPRELVNLSEASRRTGLSRRTLTRWANADPPRLLPVGLDPDGVNLYDLATVRDLARPTRRRTRGS